MTTSVYRWRFPSLSIHGVEGAFSGQGCKTVIPRKVIGKFSVRIVPNHTIEQVNSLFFTLEFYSTKFDFKINSFQILRKVYFVHSLVTNLVIKSLLISSKVKHDFLLKILGYI